jgi:AhpD family alkylhydroperoxidase
MARLPYITRDDLPDDYKYLWDRNRTVTGTDAIANIFRTLGNNPPVWLQYARLGNALWTQSGIDTATRELIILRTAILQHSPYEWHQHVRIGRQAGLTNERIKALHHWRTSEAFSEPERAILEYVDAVAQTDHPLGEVHEMLAAHFPPATIVAINLLTGFYAMTARFLGAMEVDLEEPFVGWELEGS